MRDTLMNKINAVVLTVFALTFLNSSIGDEMMEKFVSNSSQTSTTEYWTTERMKHAIPYPVEKITGKRNTQPIELQPKKENSGTAEARLHNDNGGHIARYKNTQNMTKLPANQFNTILGSIYDYPPPQSTFNTYYNEYFEFPHTTVGKLFFTDSNGVDRVCSGAVIGNNAIVTAGHCVSDGQGKWNNKNVTFVPAYINGYAPYGKWEANSVWAINAWHNYKDYCRDIGGVTVSKNSQGKKISDLVGYLGYAWGYGTSQHWVQIGYPAASPYDGKWMIETFSSFSNSSTITCKDTSASKPVAHGTVQTDGSDGGPWIMSYKDGDYVNSVTSFYLAESPYEVYGPYFDSVVEKFLKKMREL